MKKVYLLTVLVFGLMLPISLNANEQVDNYEIIFWQSIEKTKDPELFRLYLQKYPQGEFAELAKRLIENYSTDKPTKKSFFFDDKNSLPPKKVAIFPFQLQEDAHYMQGVLTNNLYRFINTRNDLDVYASYYDLGPAGYWIPSLKGEEIKSKGIDLTTANLWSDQEPDTDTIRAIGKTIGADTIVIGSLKVRNQWSDLYVLGHIRIFAIDVETGGTSQAKNQNRLGDARELLPHVIKVAIENYISDYCTPLSKNNIHEITKD